MGDILQNAIVEFRIICETLFLTFLILKLTDVITWSWWLICSPLLALGGIVLFFLIALIVTAIINGKRREKETLSESN